MSLLHRRFLPAALLATLLVPALPGAAAAASAPTGVSAVPGNASATVSWTAVHGATGYTVVSNPGSISRAVLGSSTSALVDGLTNGTSYRFTVVARDASGFSQPSAPSPAVVPATVPDPPTGVTGRPQDSAVLVSWTAPVSDGGSVITGYTVTSTPGGLTTAASPGSRSATVAGLSNSEAYTFTVTAANDRGTSAPSSASAPVQPGTADTSEPDPAPANDTDTAPSTGGGGAGAGTGGSSGGSAGGDSAAGSGTGGAVGGGGVATTPAPSTSTPSPSTSDAPAGPPSASPTGPKGSGYTSLATAARVLDSRNGTGTTPGRKSGAVVVDLAPRVPEGATAAVLNVTVTNPTRAGFVVVHAHGDSKPSTSNVNFGGGQTQANEVIVALPPSRRAVVHVDSATAHVIADLVGWFSPDGRGRLVVQEPSRALDTRTTAARVRTGEVVLDLSKQLPSGATSVVLNVTVTGSDRRGFVVAHPTGTPRPATSNVNVERGQTQANEVFSRVGTGLNAGRVSLFIDSTSAAVIADLVAVVVEEGAAAGGLTPTVPTRALDTRTTAARRGGVVELALPAAVPTEARAVVLNVTATGASAAGYVTAYGGPASPGTSNVNFRPGATQANQVIVAIGADRKVRLLVGGQGAPQTHLIADVVAALH